MGGGGKGLFCLHGARCALLIITFILRIAIVTLVSYSAKQAPISTSRSCQDSTGEGLETWTEAAANSRLRPPLEPDVMTRYEAEFCYPKASPELLPSSSHCKRQVPGVFHNSMAQPELRVHFHVRCGGLRQGGCASRTCVFILRGRWKNA